MATDSVSTQYPLKLTPNLKVVGQICTSDMTTLAALPISEAGVVGTWWDMRDYESLLVFCGLSARTDNIEKLEIWADTLATGLGGNYSIVQTAPITVDAITNWAVAEITAEQIGHQAASLGVDLRYISPAVKTGSASDDVYIVVIGKPKRAKIDLTENYVV